MWAKGLLIVAICFVLAESKETELVKPKSHQTREPQVTEEREQVVRKAYPKDKIDFIR